MMLCICGHDAGSHSSLRFNCLANLDGTHATRCSCKCFVSAPASAPTTPTEPGYQSPEERRAFDEAQWAGGEPIILMSASAPDRLREIVRLAHEVCARLPEGMDGAVDALRAALKDGGA
jgi:hypothetical protein